MKKLVVVCIGLACLVLVGGIFWWQSVQSPAHNCAFSDTIRSEASSIQLYCLDEKSLPKGVVSHQESAIKRESAILFSVNDGDTQLAVSLQPKPADTQVTKFVSGAIPLNIETITPVGTAKTGISGKQSIASLVTDKTWILVTAPANYDTDRLSKILQAFHKD